MEVLVTAPGARSIRQNADTGQPSGLGSTIAPWSAWPPRAPAPRLHALVNLGDEAAGVVLINVPLPALVGEIASQSHATVGELTTSFLRTRPDYPPVRLRLEPGEGCRIPATGLILDGDATDNAEPVVLLLVTEEAVA
jgi:hypothetical protein